MGKFCTKICIRNCIYSFVWLCEMQCAYKLLCFIPAKITTSFFVIIVVAVAISTIHYVQATCIRLVSSQWLRECFVCKITYFELRKWWVHHIICRKVYAFFLLSLSLNFFLSPFVSIIIPIAPQFTVHHPLADLPIFRGNSAFCSE